MRSDRNERGSDVPLGRRVFGCVVELTSRGDGIKKTRARCFGSGWFRSAHARFSFSFDGRGTSTLQVGDDVYVRGEGAVPFMARIEEVKRTKGDVHVKLMWYYRPEDAIGGRKPFHGKKEVFLSDHFDWCSHQCVSSKCRVHTLRQYQELPHVEDGDYYHRFTYKAEQKRFQPDRIPVYCVCELPYNPDQDMVECDACADWYHFSCVGIDAEEVSKMDTFVCPICLEEKKDLNVR